VGRLGAVLSPSPLQTSPARYHTFGPHVMLGERLYARASARHLGFPAVDPISGQ
jgi:hypothetical protein